MPGVDVTTTVRTGPSTETVNASSEYFIVGTAVRGPVDRAVGVNSISDFEAYYGGYAADRSLHQHLQTFFEEGGSRAYVSRVVGASATAGTATLGNLLFTAANPGTWSNTLSVTVVAAGSGRKVQLSLDGDVVYVSPVIPSGLDGEQAVVAAFAASSVARAYATVALTAAESAALAIHSAELFAGGVNGATPDEATILTGLALLESSLGSGAVAAPGLYSATAYDALIAHAVANNRVALLAADPAYATGAEAIAGLGSYIALLDNGEYASLYFPHVNIVNGTGTPLVLSPESYVAAKRAIAHNTVGAWAVGAGVDSKASFVTGVAVPVDKTDGAALDAAQINAIRIIQNTVRVYGARSLSSDEINFRFINSRDMLNFIVSEAENRLEDLVFAPIDGRRTVFGAVESTLVALLDPLRTAGGLFEAFDADGRRIDSGYTVEVSDALNPLAQLADGVVRAKVGVRISGISDRIEIDIVKSNLTSSVV